MTNPALLLLGFTLLAVPTALSQAPAAPAPTAPAPPPATGAPIFRQRADTHVDTQRADRETVLRSIGGDQRSMGIVPPGTWWKNPETISRLALTADQQKRMDDIFRQSRIQLIDVKASLEKEQLNLDPLLNANPVDSARALAEISRIADLRADLEKANAKMLLNLRSVLTADQWTKLQEDRHTRRGGPMELHFQGGPGGPIGSLESLYFGDWSDMEDRLADLRNRIGAMNIQIPEIHIPEIHIPEFKVPEIVIPKIVIPEVKFPADMRSAG